MILYTCAGRNHGGSIPLVQHPCGLAAKALDEAGHQYEIEVVGGFKRVPFSRRGRRDRIIELTGQEDVPVLVADDGTIVQGSERIVAWARANPA
jgi:hypothetical protein